MAHEADPGELYSVYTEMGTPDSPKDPFVYSDEGEDQDAHSDDDGGSADDDDDDADPDDDAEDDEADLLTTADLQLPDLLPDGLQPLPQLTREHASLFLNSEIHNVDLLGSGHFGVTFSATHTSAQGESTVVVIKVQKADVGSPDTDEMLLQMLIPPDPYVLPATGFMVDFTAPPLEDLGITDRLCSTAIVVPLLSQGSLLAYLRARLAVMNPLWAARSACMMARGIRHLHKYGVVHRDLALRNFLVGPIQPSQPVPDVVLADFGLAVSLGQLDAQRKSKTRENKRFPWRRCPPEFHVHRHPWTLASDVWQFGIVLWELWMVGQQQQGADSEEAAPFSQVGGPGALCDLLLRGQGRPSDALREELPDQCSVEFLNLIDACLAIQPTERPSMDEVVATLDGILAQLLAPSQHQKTPAAGAQEAGGAAGDGEGAEEDSASKIIVDREDRAAIDKLLPNTRAGLEWVRVFRASDDGFDTDVFNFKLSGLDKTVHLVKTKQGAIFGGYLPYHPIFKLGSPGVFHVCLKLRDSFVFSLRRPHLDGQGVARQAPVLLPVRERMPYKMRAPDRPADCLSWFGADVVTFPWQHTENFGVSALGTCYDFEESGWKQETASTWLCAQDDQIEDLEVFMLQRKRRERTPRARDAAGATADDDAAAEDDAGTSAAAVESADGTTAAAAATSLRSLRSLRDARRSAAASSFPQQSAVTYSSGSRSPEGRVRKHRLRKMAGAVSRFATGAAGGADRTRSPRRARYEDATDDVNDRVIRAGQFHSGSSRSSGIRRQPADSSSRGSARRTHASAASSGPRPAPVTSVPSSETTFPSFSSGFSRSSGGGAGSAASSSRTRRGFGSSSRS